MADPGKLVPTRLSEWDRQQPAFLTKWGPRLLEAAGSR
jgi:hypothetical protein